MRILMAHNFYQHPGGEDQVFAAESELLAQRGHAVFQLTRDYPALQKLSRPVAAMTSVWNAGLYRELRKAIQREKIDLVHFHNTFPLVSPSAYYAARAERVPVVQSLHNYRLLCPGGLFYREGVVCEDCLERAIPWPGVRHACYRGSALQSGALAGMLTLHRTIRTWSRAVDLYIALTDFARRKFVAGGLPAAKIAVKANFMSADPGVGTGEGGFALFAGRITRDKGVQVLMDAWRMLGSDIPLKVVGDGPLLEDVSKEARELPGIQVMGPRPRQEVLELMKAASVLVVPSLWYEGFPMTIVEAYACGLPVIASDMGSLSSVVEEGVTGFRFAPGNPAALGGSVRRAITGEPGLKKLREGARKAFDDLYNPAKNYTALMAAYEAAKRNRMSAQ